MGRLDQARAPGALVHPGTGAGFRPNDFSQGGFLLTAMLTFEPVEGGTKYTARTMHATAEANTTHAAMGFVAGWGAALDQLVTYMKTR